MAVKYVDSTRTLSCIEMKLLSQKTQKKPHTIERKKICSNNEFMENVSYEVDFHFGGFLGLFSDFLGFPFFLFFLFQLDFFLVCKIQ